MRSSLEITPISPEWLEAFWASMKCSQSELRLKRSRLCAPNAYQFFSYVMDLSAWYRVGMVASWAGTATSVRPAGTPRAG